MRYDRNYAYFRPHFDWYTFKVGVGYVPTEKAPPEAIEAMEKFNSYTYNADKTKNTNIMAIDERAAKKLYERYYKDEK